MITRSSRISPDQQEQLLKCFAMDTTASQAGILAKINRNTANLYFNHFREVIFDIYNKAPRFSGEVEVDQALFGRGSKKETHDKKFESYGDPTYFKKHKRKKKKTKQRVLVFGILRRGGDVYTHVIKKADRDTLLPIIHLVVENKTTIFSDAWPAYNDLKIDGYKHGVINHSTGYINKKGAHTGGIDSFWSFSKERLRKFHGITPRTFQLHLKECEWRWNIRPKVRDSYSHINLYKNRLTFLKKIIKFERYSKTGS